MNVVEQELARDSICYWRSFSMGHSRLAFCMDDDDRLLTKALGSFFHFSISESKYVIEMRLCLKESVSRICLIVCPFLRLRTSQSLA
jgi:hypothetical protein